MTTILSLKTQMEINAFKEHLMRTKRFIWFEKQLKNKGMFSACALLLGIWTIFSRKSENQ